ncbi:MAG TPA: hypothetical protein VHW01_03850 [Polyangiaceae bacterium]|jgi:hypothetical protein|nr:hypothetical protein [Polyangiaceae bacterium]
MTGKITLRFAALAVLCMASSRAAKAQEVSSGSSVAAQALFDEAKRLIQQGDAAAACPKLEESERLEPGIGTKLNLANCYEKVGRSASAWILYLEVESDTKRNGQVERQTMAHNRAAALQPKLSHLTINVPSASRVPGLVVERDGVAVGEAQWGLSIPVDPGAHTVKVHAAGKKDWESTLDVAADASAQTLSVPALDDAPAATQAASSEAKPRSRALRTGAFVSFGVSGVGAVLGTVFGLRAISKNHASNADGKCAGNDCSPDGVTLRNASRNAGNISTVAFAVSGAALATGFVLFFIDAKKEAPATAQLGAGAFAIANGGELSLRGAW